MVAAGCAAGIAGWFSSLTNGVCVVGAVLRS
jgi:hypothetical protein